jgi:tRNA dimethylallyltransferase
VVVANSKLSIIVITGPTGCGKTALAIELAKQVDGEIINADSVQVYKYFDIGSAKPSSAQLAAVPHHLISILEPEEDFNAGVFCSLADRKIQELSSFGKIPIVTGGTGLYIQSLIHGLAEIKDVSEVAKQSLQEKEEEILKNLEGQDKINEKFKAELYNFLSNLDKEAANVIKPSDISRVRRAILVKLSNDKSILSYQQSHGHKNKNYNAFIVILIPQRDLAYHLINARVDEMLQFGFLEEVETLKQKYGAGISQVKSFSGIGYKQLLQFKDNQFDYSTAVEKIKQETRRYAKRQFTWWKNQPRKLGWEPMSGVGDLIYNYSSLDFKKIAEDVGRLYNMYLTDTALEQGIKINFLPVKINNLK